MATSPQHSREFEFQMSVPLDQWEPMASPADELFYKGKLLPLHLPPRIQLVEKLLESAADKGLLSASTAPATPYMSCNVSPANSCYVSGELNAEHYFQECISAGLHDAEAAASCDKKPWSKKLKFIRHLNLGLKLKASKAYLKTIFATKGGNPDDKNGAPRAYEHSNAQFKTWRKNPFGNVRSNRYIASPVSNSSTLGGKIKEDECGHRRSFSSVIIRYSSSNKTSSVSSSSCSSSNSSSFSIPSSNDSGPVLRRSSSASSEMDNPIQGAIAYCKKSQQLASVRKSASDAGFRFMSSSASKIAAESPKKKMSNLERKPFPEIRYHQLASILNYATQLADTRPSCQPKEHTNVITVTLFQRKQGLVADKKSQGQWRHEFLFPPMPALAQWRSFRVTKASKQWTRSASFS